MEDTKKAAPLDMAARLEMLEKIVATQEEKIEAEKAARTATSAVVVEDTPQYEPIPKETFELDKATYKFLVSGIWHEGKKYLAKDIMQDEKMLKDFVGAYPKSVQKIA